MTPQVKIEPIERVERLSLARFRQEYDRPGKPIVITNALDWPAFKHWTHKWFKDQFGSKEVELSVNPTHTHKTVKMPLGAYIDRILSNDRMAGGLYLDQFPVDLLPTLRRDYSVPEYCNQSRTILSNLWVGPGTTVISFHKDNHTPFDPIDNIFVQIHGRKRVLLVSPEYDFGMYPREGGAHWHSQVDPENPDWRKFPRFADVILQDAIVGPGDILFIPRNYWHHVRALEKSISMSFWWSPYRLAEILGKIIKANDDEFALVLSANNNVITPLDIDEFGGVVQLKKLFSFFKDASILNHVCKRLMDLADEAAKPIISGAYKKANGMERLL